MSAIDLSHSTWPVFADDEIAAVSRVLASGKVNYWTGQETREFEREFAAYTGMPYGIALANGTLALELALVALNIGHGDEVITTPRTFLASASVIVMRGATPVFADIDPISQNISAETIAPHINSRTRAIIPVHLAGWPCDMDPIMELAERHSIAVIEDCAQAHGAKYKGRPVGGIGHLSAFSFCQDKIMTTGGEGGMLLLRDEKLWNLAWSFKDHGKSFEAVYQREHPPGFRWLHESFGTNWRMTEMQGALGRVQLQKLDGWVAIRRRNAKRLHELLSPLPALQIEEPGDDYFHSYYKFYVRLKPERLRDGISREDIVDAVQAAGVPCMVGSCSEVYLEKAFDGTPWRPAKRLSQAKLLGDTAFLLLVHPTLNLESIEKMAEVVGNVISEKTF